MTNSQYLQVVKPICDRLAALFLIAASSPLMLLIMITLWFANDGKVWFLQDRPGEHGKLFKLIKFRTMTDARDGAGRMLPDQQRLTRVGKLIRKMSMDELPQMFNVVRGEMSLVGPRPLLTHYLGLYNSFQMRRHEVKPGITGWAQVNGRNAVEWPKRFELDVWYVDHVTFWLDLKIIFITVLRVLSAKGISSTTSETMENFTGNE